MSGWGLRTQPPWMERVGAGPGKGGARQNGGTPAGMQGQDIEREVAENEGPLLSERLDRVPTLPPPTRCATLGKLLSLSPWRGSLLCLKVQVLIMILPSQVVVRIKQGRDRAHGS